jgi:hypothetical protein
LLSSLSAGKCRDGTSIIFYQILSHSSVILPFAAIRAVLLTAALRKPQSRNCLSLLQLCIPATERAVYDHGGTNITVLPDMKSCSLADSYRCFRVSCCLLLQCRRHSNLGRLNIRYPLCGDHPTQCPQIQISVFTLNMEMKTARNVSTYQSHH